MEDLKKTTLHPGDTLVVTVKDTLPNHHRAAIAAAVREETHHPGPITVMDGMSLGVLTAQQATREADLLEANTRLHNRNAELSFALLIAVAKFRFYEGQHRAKGTPDADRKAEVNHDLAARLESVAMVHGTGPSDLRAAWRSFALAHQLAANFSGMLAAYEAWHLRGQGAGLEPKDKALTEEWGRMLDQLGQHALERAPEGALTMKLAPDPEEAPHKPTAQTVAGSIAVGGSQLVEAFVAADGTRSRGDRGLLEAFAAFAVQQLKERTLGADFQIVDTPAPSDTSVVVKLDGLVRNSCVECGRATYSAAEPCPTCPDVWVT